ncbi:MAG: ATP-binding protein [Deltaproteobacteria bacterium]|nr:ATP-binding protein [Deltaproteobacteria bacterium]
MLRTYNIVKNNNFVGRVREWQRLERIVASQQSAVVVVHGRRRVGKTELLEQFFRQRNVLKFEGIEGQDESYQKRSFAMQLAEYLGAKSTITNAANSWPHLLRILADETAQGAWTIYLEEFQWMAAYHSTLVAELKYIWDNHLRHNPELILVLCGSSPSFMTTSVVRSKSLYSRSLHELPLKPFSLTEATQFLAKHDPLDVLQIYLSVGGIPEYLHYFRTEKSVPLALSRESFLPGGYFTSEYDRIFVSALGDKPEYKKVINFLAMARFASRQEISRALGVESGGGLTDILENLEQSDLIESYWRFGASPSSKLKRYAIKDYYLQFYGRFIYPMLEAIKDGAFVDQPTKPLNLATFQQWLGYSLERFVRHHQYQLASHLGFSAVDYKAGPFFRRSDLNDGRGYQVDLVFDRADRVLTICEIKHTRAAVGTAVIDDVEQKIERMLSSSRSLSKRTIQRVLVAPNGATDAVRNRMYFDAVVGLEAFVLHPFGP